MTKQSEEVGHSELVDGSETVLHSHTGGGGLPKYFYAEDDSQQSQAGTTWQQKLRLDIPSGNAGTYLVEGSYTFRPNANGREVQVVVVLDDSEQLHETIDGRIVSGSGDWLDGKFIKKVTLDSNAHTIDVDFRMANDTGKTAYMKECRLIAKQIE